MGKHYVVVVVVLHDRITWRGLNSVLYIWLVWWWDGSLDSHWSHRVLEFWVRGDDVVGQAGASQDGQTDALAEGSTGVVKQHGSAMLHQTRTHTYYYSSHGQNVSQ